MYFLIKSSLLPCSLEDCHKDTTPYVAVMTPQEWQAHKAIFEMGIDLEPELNEIYTTKAEENYDSLTGTFSIPRRGDIDAEEIKFSFALDERGVVFIDKSGFAEGIVKRIYATRRWRLPGLERFLYDFLETIIHDDLPLMERFESKLDQIEKDILDKGEDDYPKEINLIRSEIRDLRIHYEQLIDFTQELEENENGFFREENLRYFRLFSNRMDRLYGTATSLRDYTMQLGDLYQSQIDLKQNKIMTILTVVTTIFMPLTLITGWYGMNFTYMPELDSPYGYPLVIASALIIAIASLLYFKKKKWL